MIHVVGFKNDEIENVVRRLSFVGTERFCGSRYGCPWLASSLSVHKLSVDPDPRVPKSRVSDPYRYSLDRDPDPDPAF
jgi:hypothetical protein